MSTYTYIIIAISISCATIFYIFLPLFKVKFFNKYFHIALEESYNLNDLFPIKIKGEIIPKVDFLDIPYQDLNIGINTKTIRGNIENNLISLELIRPKDRKKTIYLIKSYYIRAVKSYIKETIKSKKEYIELINISKKQRQNMKKIACQTCKNRIQCQISFAECNYERDINDKILNKGITIKSSRNYEMDNLQ